jgi:hypothetical protein
MGRSSPDCCRQRSIEPDDANRFLRACQGRRSSNCDSSRPSSDGCIRGSGRHHSSRADGPRNALCEAGRANRRDRLHTACHHAPATGKWRLEGHLLRRWRLVENPNSGKLHPAVGEVLCIRRRRRDGHRLQHAVGIHHAAAAAPKRLQSRDYQKDRCQDPVLIHGNPQKLSVHVQGVC